MWEKIINEILGGLDAVGAKELLHELETLGEGIAAKNLSKSVSHLLLKAVDAVVVAAVKNLDDAHALGIAQAYVEQVDRDLATLAEAVAHYVPLQLAVEVAKKEHGAHSAEANVARHARQAGIDAVRTDVGDVFADLIGQHVNAG